MLPPSPPPGTNGTTGSGGRNSNGELRPLQAVLADSANGGVVPVVVPADEVDALPEKMQYTYKDLAVVLLSIVSFLVDTGTDVWVAVHFYRTERMYEFALTLVFILVPALTMTGFSLRWYLNDADQGGGGAEQTDCPGSPSPTRPRVPMWKWILRIICLTLQLGPLLRYIEAMVYGIKSMRAKRAGDRAGHIKNYIYMIYKDADATLLRLFESFMESAPQLVLQLYILASEHNRFKPSEPLNITLQVAAVGTSLFSLAWSLCSYQRSLRYSLPAKNNLSTPATVVLFFWHLCSIGSRVLAISLCASLFPVYVAIGLVVHWVLMTIWLICQKTQACYTKCEEMLFVLVLGAVYIFTFFNVKDQTTRLKYTLYYLLCFAENTAMITLWYLNANRTLWWYHPGLAAQVILFALAVSCMLAYYCRLHPSRGREEPSGICVTGQVCRDATLAQKYGARLEEWAGNRSRGETPTCNIQQPAEGEERHETEDGAAQRQSPPPAVVVAGVPIHQNGNTL
ncbi:XK-related protein 6-like [Amphibalanus amphitrite]|uniref:XK-related protein 6-like n=1 Tax=Amphibalanus amphitrite TaxID=1232801 RepID=UPI001C919F3A|nr:XK-related protein 6-like [Amphibalanus amphitrite]XP_043197516.1 XK-related protein 6-like [Amphibalanus amphitrite]XP_043197517.1 XK-related protein 6-like [Amphibalanus amphitrite]XP_043197518.1 XK-related protein 6-like [Amphibalanus amphitrite]XP_043197519.1 XK-related protein 6-like [Amphibalanus amphitrite]XP_043197520.1 XK-related protein 6-like [Amphibalanus amphitrite]